MGINERLKKLERLEAEYYNIPPNAPAHLRDLLLHNVPCGEWSDDDLDLYASLYAKDSEMQRIRAMSDDELEQYARSLD